MKFSTQVIQWHQTNGRHDLPWQQNVTPYRTWVSEVMLQQTTVSTVIHYFDRFMSTFPDIASLASASLESVLAQWAGLGYYRRARYLHKGAQHIMAVHNGKFPSGFDDMLKIPGIGESTAGAIRSLAFNNRGVILDGNVKRVLARYIGIKEPLYQPNTMRQLWQHAHSLSPESQYNIYSQAMMDIGATICHKSQPSCQYCPVNKGCYSFKHQLQNEIPAKNVKKKAKAINMSLMLIMDGTHILLEKQASDGLWADMWLPPSCHMPLQKNVRLLSPFQHILTHFRITVFPFLQWCKRPIGLKDHQRWVAIDDTSTPKPKIVDKCIRTALNSTANTVHT